MTKHKHLYTTPIRFENRREFFPTDDKGGGYEGKMYTAVTRLRCECGEEKKI